ncbi:DUF6924 domain-containing protein [Streptomyces sp. NPDC008150]|uniref:DUF6924 domain-containing protein n=1 Tax=Streptomyces sp. NPDC008150 TaxID=3364816 RepID=UPI0036E1A811
MPRTDEDYPPMLVVRTDHRDDAAWQRVRNALDEPWVFDARDEDNGSLKEEIRFVDDPAWADASPDEILAALTASEDGEEPVECGWAVVFLADRTSMEGPRPTLLAVSTDPEEETPPFRISASVTPHEMHCNLAIANMDFDDFEDWDDASAIQ